MWRGGEWKGFVRIEKNVLPILTCVMQFGIIYAVDRKAGFL